MSSREIELTEDQQLLLLNEWNGRPDDPPYIKELIELFSQTSQRIKRMVGRNTEELLKSS